MHEVFASFSFIFGTWPWAWVAVVFLVSLLVGSFLNVVIHRLPVMLDKDWRGQGNALLADNVAREEEPGETLDLEAGAAGLAAQAHSGDRRPAPPYNLVVPRSACVNCGTMITAGQNIPVVSYLLLGGRCAN